MRLSIDVGNSIYDEHGVEYIVKALRKDSKRYYYTCSSTKYQEIDYIFMVPTWVWTPRTQREKEGFVIQKKTRNRLRKLLKTT
jgi:hypothetical protein